MPTHTFALVVTTVADGPTTGPVTGILGAYAFALTTRLSSYWDAMSGGRVELAWAPAASLQVTQSMREWAALSITEKVAEARRQALEQELIGAGTEIIVIANDADASRAATPRGSSPYVHVSLLTPTTVAHELGHYFEWRGSRKAGHADVARNFLRDEYADRTCIMGGEQFTFRDRLIPALAGGTNSTDSGPGMNPALVDQCGWLDTSSPLVFVMNPAQLGQVTLKPWRGAPRADAPAGGPVVAILDGRALEQGRLYVCVREARAWDRGFASPFLTGPTGEPHKLLCVYLSTPSGDSLLLGSGPAVKGTTLVLGRVPLRVTVSGSTPEGVTVVIEESPWRGSYALEGVECAPAAQVAVAAWDQTADAYVIDRNGKARYNHFNGHGWEHTPWPLLDGVTCDPLGGIAAVARREGLVDVFVTDREGVVHRLQRHHRTWSQGWTSLPGGGLGPQSSLAATRIDDARVLLCGVGIGGHVVRTEVSEDATTSGWVEATSPRPMRLVAATPDDASRGRIYAMALPNPDRSLWATPNLGDPDPGWGALNLPSLGDVFPIAATRSVGGSDVVVVGTTPIRLLTWDGAAWAEHLLGEMSRQKMGGLAVMSRAAQSFDILYVDASGVVQVSPWSRDKDFAPAWNQYDSDGVVVLQAATGHFVRAANGGGEGMAADSVAFAAWERLRMRVCQTVKINAGEERQLVAFQAHSGHYVGAVGGGGSHLIAQATQVGPWELFYLEHLPGFVTGIGPVTLRCIDETHYWSAVGGGGQALAADKRTPEEWERFTLMVVE